MGRFGSASTRTDVPGCGMHVRPPPHPTSWSNGATGMTPSCVTLIDGVAPHVIVAFQKSIWSAG